MRKYSREHNVSHSLPSHPDRRFEHYDDVLSKKEVDNGFILFTPPISERLRDNSLDQVRSIETPVSSSSDVKVKECDIPELILSRSLWDEDGKAVKHDLPPSEQTSTKGAIRHTFTPPLSPIKASPPFDTNISVKSITTDFAQKEDDHMSFTTNETSLPKYDQLSFASADDKASREQQAVISLAQEHNSVPSSPDFEGPSSVDQRGFDVSESGDVFLSNNATILPEYSVDVAETNASSEVSLTKEQEEQATILRIAREKLAALEKESQHETPLDKDSQIPLKPKERSLRSAPQPQPPAPTPDSDTEEKPGQRSHTISVVIPGRVQTIIEEAAVEDERPRRGSVSATLAKSLWGAKAATKPAIRDLPKPPTQQTPEVQSSEMAPSTPRPRIDSIVRERVTYLDPENLLFTPTPGVKNPFAPRPAPRKSGSSPYVSISSDVQKKASDA
jgi:hypothetical protein